MNQTINGASQQTMPNERDDGNTTIIHFISTKAGKKERVLLDGKIKALVWFTEDEKTLLQTALLIYIADRNVIKLPT